MCSCVYEDDILLRSLHPFSLTFQGVYHQSYLAHVELPNNSMSEEFTATWFWCYSISSCCSLVLKLQEVHLTIEYICDSSLQITSSMEKK